MFVVLIIGRNERKYLRSKLEILQHKAFIYNYETSALQRLLLLSQDTFLHWFGFEHETGRQQIKKLSHLQ